MFYGTETPSLCPLLKELERDGLILRKEYPQVPPKVEYNLTETGKSLMPVLHGICGWGMEHFDSNR
jgi:Predicted transcriptional regulators